MLLILIAVKLRNFCVVHIFLTITLWKSFVPWWLLSVLLKSAFFTEVKQQVRAWSWFPYTLFITYSLMFYLKIDNKITQERFLWKLLKLHTAYVLRWNRRKNFCFFSDTYLISLCKDITFLLITKLNLNRSLNYLSVNRILNYNAATPINSWYNKWRRSHW